MPCCLYDTTTKCDDKLFQSACSVAYKLFQANGLTRILDNFNVSVVIDHRLAKAGFKKKTSVDWPNQT